jgi:aminoglycoside phosphotransferase (APT) family kinase protein
MHATSGAELPDHTASLRRSVELAADQLGRSRAGAVLRRLELLVGGSVVCHGDLHPGNVIMAASGPVVIDWLTAGCGPAEADLARTQFLLTGSVVPDAYPWLQRVLIAALRRRFAGTYLRTYRRLRPLDDRQLELWRLPLLAARLAEGIEAERASLLASIDAELAGSLA